MCSKGGKAFIEALLPRLDPKNMNGGPSMPFELEVSILITFTSTLSKQKKCMWFPDLISLPSLISLSVSL